jgi:hypothetical protein
MTLSSEPQSTKADFGIHPSDKLQEIFSKRPFQIQEPEKAKIIFLGLDANLNYDIEENEKTFFQEMLEYFTDGVKYWKENGIHTPMLKPCYTGNGKRYHNQFCKLGFTTENAKDICFIELMKYCTYGNSSKNKNLFKEMLLDNENKNHLDRIRNLFEMEKLICIPHGVETFINELALFNVNNKKIIVHTHFSDSIANNELFALGKILKKYIASNAVIQDIKFPLYTKKLNYQDF